MYVKELWRYPVKSLAGEQVEETFATEKGFPDDRKVLVVGANGRIVTSRTHHRLLGLKGTLRSDGVPLIDGQAWDSAEALALVREIAGPAAKLTYYEGLERFDVLPLLVASDGAIDRLGYDRRRFRPNILVGGVEGLAERLWPGRRLQIGEAVIEAVQLRGRCVMTTYDPDTLVQDRNVLKRIVSEYDGTLGLDSSVVIPGRIRVGDEVTVK